MELLFGFLWIVGGFGYICYRIHKDEPDIIPDSLKCIGIACLPLIPLGILGCEAQQGNANGVYSCLIILIGMAIYGIDWFVIETKKSAGVREITQKQAVLYRQARDIADKLPKPTKEEIEECERTAHLEGRDWRIVSERDWRYEQQIKIYRKLKRENGLDIDTLEWEKEYYNAIRERRKARLIKLESAIKSARNGVYRFIKLFVYKETDE